MNSINVIHKLESTLPIIGQWIDDLLNSYRSQSIAISDLDFRALPQLFPLDLLQKTRVVMISGKIPYPPLSSMGFPNLSSLENTAFAGVTYKDTYFLNRAYRQENIHFHELIHVVQWDTLGVDDFLRAYGIGLLQSGYQMSPLEQMAYSLQSSFENGSLRKTDLVELVKMKTQTIWNSLSPMFSINRVRE